MGFKFPELHKDTKPFCLGALAGAMLLWWVGFDGLQWSTKGAAESVAVRRAEAATIATQARICSAQFTIAKDPAGRLADLKKTERYSRGEVLAKTGFATMAGDKEPVSGVPQACADLLIPGGA